MLTLYLTPYDGTDISKASSCHSSGEVSSETWGRHPGFVLHRGAAGAREKSADSLESTSFDMSVVTLTGLEPVS